MAWACAHTETGGAGCVGVDATSSAAASTETLAACLEGCCAEEGLAQKHSSEVLSQAAADKDTVALGHDCTTMVGY